MQTNQYLKSLLLQEIKLNFKAEVIDSLDAVKAADWDRLAGSDNPFISHAYLYALEESGCVTAETGWQPQHILIFDPSDTLIGAMPLYLKNHSYGEYVFDHGWANAYERIGRHYYPKMQSSIPFTPATSPKFLIDKDQDHEHIIGLLLNAAQQLTNARDASSLHITFIDKLSCSSASNFGMLDRNDIQYHWHNNNYRCFEDFLARLSSRKRKQIKKERKSIETSGIKIRWLTGGDIKKEDWDSFYQFYIDTGNRKWGTPYLNRGFFNTIGHCLPKNIVLMMAYIDDIAIAGALNFIGGNVIYGRHWGCSQNVKNLHFELCYYQAIDYAIAHNLSYVEAGAQGQHKLARGYIPTKTYSAHWLSDPEFQEAVSHYLEGERVQIDLVIKALNLHTPYAK